MSAWGPARAGGAVADHDAGSRCPVTAVPPPGEPVHSGGDVVAEATEFRESLHAERQLPGLAARLAEVREEIALTGSYRHTREELVYGARVAWRQSVVCGAGPVGGVAGDRRHVTTAAGIAGELSAHLAAGDNGGRIQSVITVFAPDRPGVGPRARIWNDQLVRYCGYLRDDGGVVGDPGAGGDGAGGPPVGVAAAAGAGSVRPVAVGDPDGARVAVGVAGAAGVGAGGGVESSGSPVVRGSDAALACASGDQCGTRLRIGGVDYSCAPFNGHYWVTRSGPGPG